MVPGLCCCLLILCLDLHVQAAYQEVQAFAKYGGAKSVAGFTTQQRDSSGKAQPTLLPCGYLHSAGAQHTLLAIHWGHITCV